MDHAERNKLARALTARLVAEHGDAILLGGVFGSAARGDDTEWSDLDLLYVLREGTALRGRTFLFQGAPVVLNVLTQAELEASLRAPNPSWPFWMGVLDVLRPLAGDVGHLRRWMELGQSLDDTAFRVAVEPHMPGLVLESYGRIRSSAARNNQRDAAHAAIEVLYEMKTALCLLNRRWVTRDYFAGLEQSFAFPLRPQGWEQMAPQLWDARELGAIVAVAGTLMGAYWRLLASCGMMVQNYQTVESVAL
jgi:hypothetical protein